MTDTDRKLIPLLYAIFAAAVPMQATLETALVGTAALIVALSIAQMRRRKSAAPADAHYQYLARTFWIGGGVYLPVLTVVAAVYVFLNLDLSIVEEMAAGSGDYSDAEVNAAILQSNAVMMHKAVIWFTLPAAIWWLWRCWRGFSALRVNLAPAKISSWI